MEELKFSGGKIPRDEPKKLSMDEYLAFVLFNRKNFSDKIYSDAPAPVRFVIRENDEPFSSTGLPKS
ncbi:MAG: hypothetical protein A2351_01735 [Omnitrophica bacterium RIFOXYB12_FULL_50_7]|nr:MAG: hypothetical protein A2351_01735 [Omnitrophica bacterium RIFOXYB12_FULL_50_7]